MSKKFLILTLFLWALISPTIQLEEHNNEETPICGGFLEFESNIGPEVRKSLDYSSIIVQTFTMDMILKEHTNLAASGYYFLPIYENESFIMKISGPHGMSFEPEQYVFHVEEGKSVSSYCAQDINFKFRGFVVEGQVSTFGSNNGPEGISLVLFDSENQKVQTTKTVENGLFKFKPANPGTYTLKPLEDIHMFDKNHSELKFQVKLDSSNFLERALIIRGFKVTGRVEADNQPLDGVSVLIYTFNSTLIENYSCDLSTTGSKLNINNLLEYTYKDMTPFCAVQTAKDGIFTFKNIPYGKFLIKPVYKNEFISYDLEPESLTIDVEHRDLNISTPFQAKHFAIFGKVVNSKGSGIPNVTIKIDGQVRAITDAQGAYRLQNLTPGNYDLEAQADDMFFEPLTNIRITAHLKKLPDLAVTDYKLCGKIVIEATDYYPTSKRTVVLQETSDKSASKKERRTITDNKGKYCFEVKPGVYHIYPVLTQDEKESDLHLQPEFYDLEIVDRPLLDINFYQSKVNVSGKISCLKECDKNIRVKLTSTKTDRMLTTQINEKQEFLFKDILSGQYKLEIIKPEWCWTEEDIVIKVQNSDIKDINFNQAGYSLFYSSQHNIDIEWENTETKAKQTTVLEKNKSKICLPAQGTYKVTPKSCYKFKESHFIYQTDKSPKLELTPFEYLARGEIELEEDLYQKARSNNLSDLGVNILINEKSVENGKPKLTLYKQLNLKTQEKISLFEFYTKPDTTLTIIPTIPQNLISKENYKNLIFLPKEKELIVKHSCITDEKELKFVMKSGLIIEGTVTPAMEGVLLTAYNTATKESVSSTYTDNKGEYKIGPLYKENQYEIKASKDGYKIVPEAKNPYNFNAEKLSFLRVKVVDTNGKPLSSVFLSLSSADRGFKINNNTNSEGYYDFFELYSGEYYIKPLFKEYKFEPSQKLVKILGGQHYEETLVAHRIAFSIYGKINNLNKEKVEGLYIQAYDEKTRQLQETAIDKNGEYRLKGLNPGNKYIIKVKIPQNSCKFFKKI
jgi:protocatechuate 3,4-dioxygenase beta subunit